MKNKHRKLLRNYYRAVALLVPVVGLLETTSRAAVVYDRLRQRGTA